MADLRNASLMEDNSVQWQLLELSIDIIAGERWVNISVPMSSWYWQETRADVIGTSPSFYVCICYVKELSHVLVHCTT